MDDKTFSPNIYTVLDYLSGWYPIDSIRALLIRLEVLDVRP